MKIEQKTWTEEEVEEVRDILGAETVLSGFYSYREICLSTPGTECQLHNQTIKITALSAK